jgi:hypothetical protein
MDANIEFCVEDYKRHHMDENRRISTDLLNKDKLWLYTDFLVKSTTLAAREDLKTNRFRNSIFGIVGEA